MGLGRGYSWWI